MARGRHSAKAKKGGRKNKKCDKKTASPKAVPQPGNMKGTGFMDMPPELLLMVYNNIGDLFDKFALVKACSPSILDDEVSLPLHLPSRNIKC
jgi:hypothetical protein